MYGWSRCGRCHLFWSVCYVRDLAHLFERTFVGHAGDVEEKCTALFVFALDAQIARQRLGETVHINHAPELIHCREPGRYAAYGYEATAATLAAIDDAEDPTDRGDVVDAFFAIEDRESILGAYSIDEVGNTTLGSLGAYEVGRSGEPRPVSEPITLP